MEHYQSTLTPQPSMHKLPPITPNVEKNSLRQDESCLPEELRSNCSHGLKVSWPVSFVPLRCRILFSSALDMLNIVMDTARPLPRRCTSFAGNEGQFNCNIQ